ncbi:MAG: DUF5686 family protein, partial [Bacteroidota bacterium]
MGKVLFFSILLIIASGNLFSQQTHVFGQVIDSETGFGFPFVKVQYMNSKIGAITDSLGNYSIKTYYATDSLMFMFPGYKLKSIKVNRDQSQEINITLETRSNLHKEVVIRPPDEPFAIKLHKRIIANKPVNNKEKLEAYEYEAYNKIQLDLNNIGDKFSKNGIVKRLDMIMDYLDSTDEGRAFLPIILSENVSDFYFKNKPKQKKEVVKATKVSGIENLQMNQYLGDMYLDINVYDNIYDMFFKSFISPVSIYARSYYHFYVEDSSFIGNNWCYKMRFKPKRTGDLTFSGEMWIHDTTYAIKRFSANISPDANLNYIQDFYFEQEFEQVEKEVWMMTKEKLIADIRLTEKTKVYGLFGRKTSSRRYFKINEKREPEFYKGDNTVEILDSAKLRSDAYWQEMRHQPLSKQEEKINEMIDSLQNNRFFNTMKNVTYLASTGYYPLGKIELGSIASFVAFNPVEKLRLAFALRTSNEFSKRIEFGGRIAYGFGDEKLKYGATIRYNVTPKKRGLLSSYYSYDIEQIGISSSALSMGNTFTTVLSTAPFDKLTFVTKAGLSFEKDIKKDFVTFTGFELKELTPLGLANYKRVINTDTLLISKIRTSEITARIRWAKDEEFISGSFDRTAMTCTNPILSLQGVFGIKGLFGGEYSYQKLEFQIEHYRQLGVLGRMYYGGTVGYIFGTTAYPFLKAVPGNQSLYLMSSAFNKLNFLEFVTDKYASAFIENQWEGLFFDRIPLVKKLKLRLVTTGKIAIGHISDRHQNEMLLPGFVKRFNGIPYAESSIGIENILKVIRVDLVWRMTHLDPGMSPLGVRAKFA